MLQSRDSSAAHAKGPSEVGIHLGRTPGQSTWVCPEGIAACKQPMLEQAHLEGLQPKERTYIGAALEGLLPTQGPNTETGESMRWKKQQRGTVMN